MVLRIESLAVVPTMLLWGTAVVADSARFSVIVTEVTRREVRGTALTLQTALGFLLTLVTIRLTPAIADGVGWRWGFLAAGPAVGLWTMRALRSARALAQPTSDWRRSAAPGGDSVREEMRCVPAVATPPEADAGTGVPRARHVRVVAGAVDPHLVHPVRSDLW